MNSIKILILLISLFTLNQAQILSQQLDNEKQRLVISIENLENEAVINFQNQDGQFVDQIFCQRSQCECIVTQSNTTEEHIEIQECSENKLIIQRNYSQLIASLSSSPQRRMVEVYSDSDMTDSKTIDSRLTIKWKFNSDGTIEFATIWNKKTWLGIGFGSSMSNVDMITLNVSGSTVELLDLYSTSQNTPPTDSQQDYTLISYEVGSASVKTRFKRKLSTGDSKDKTLVKGSSYSWCYAYSSALSLERHTVNLGFSITLTDSGTSSSSSSGSSSSSSGSGSTSSSGSGSSSSSGADTTSSGTDTTSSGTDTTSSGTGTTSAGSESTAPGTDSNESSENEDSDSDSDSDSTKSSIQISLGIVCMIQIILF
ncbi:unnamed protein product [Paramecium octaurelia]|uniref:DOMON domain-containing protein n=1 Tax=Paramecium octaurelia TaxID=43137 RepID=A0A8S1YNI3_PAROT|nr:unnamed protein product [Paramecium octaurelia]